jgi:hypothetical protein
MFGRHHQPRRDHSAETVHGGWDLEVQCNRFPDDTRTGGTLQWNSVVELGSHCGPDLDAICDFVDDHRYCDPRSARIIKHYGIYFDEADRAAEGIISPA